RPRRADETARGFRPHRRFARVPPRLGLGAACPVSLGPASARLRIVLVQRPLLDDAHLPRHHPVPGVSAFSGSAGIAPGVFGAGRLRPTAAPLPPNPDFSPAHAKPRPLNPGISTDVGFWAAESSPVGI